MLSPCSFRLLRHFFAAGTLLLVLFPSLAFGLSANGPFFSWVSVGSNCTAYNGYCELKWLKNGSWEHLKYIYPADGYSSHEVTLSAGTHDFKLESYDVGPRGPVLKGTATLKVAVPTADPVIASISVPAAAKSGLIEVKWPHVRGAATYMVQESHNNGSWRTIFSGPKAEVGMLTDLSYAAEVLPGTYRYRVRACRDAQCTVYKTSSAVSVTDPNEHPESRVIFIHTDLLGSPAAETDAHGRALN